VALDKLNGYLKARRTQAQGKLELTLARYRNASEGSVEKVKLANKYFYIMAHDLKQTEDLLVLVREL
jgi:hypothetical protein